MTIVSSNASAGLIVQGGFGGADENTLDVDIIDNTVTDNGFAGIEVFGGFDNSSNNHVAARIRGNIVERGHLHLGIGAIAGVGAVSFSTGTSNNNVLDYSPYLCSGCIEDRHTQDYQALSFPHVSRR